MGSLSRNHAQVRFDEGLKFYSYCCSEGKCTVQVGLVQLYALVMSLERDYHDLRRGVSIAYGSTKQYEKVAQVLGWAKKARNRREPKNDGRPPDTTKALVGSKHKKLGRPKGSLNVDRNPVTTWQGFQASSLPTRKHCCWMNSMAECLYALYTPYWFTGSKGVSTHTFHKLLTVFSSRATWEMHQSGSIRQILSLGQNKIHAELLKTNPKAFPYDEYASATHFFEMLFDNQRLQTRPTAPAITQKLFRFELQRKLFCSSNSSHVTNETMSDNCLTILPEHFGVSGRSTQTIEYSDTPEILQRLTSHDGLRCISGRHCLACPPRNNTTTTKSKHTSQRPQAPRLIEIILMHFEQAPPHLYFVIDALGLTTSQPKEAKRMTDECYLPYALAVHGVTYLMRARGFYAKNHYWCKVVRSVGGLSGVWYHNDLINEGIATLESRALTSIGGAMDDTNWAMYSRAPTTEESLAIAAANQKIEKKFGSQHQGDLPFSQPGLESEEGVGLNAEFKNEYVKNVSDGAVRAIRGPSESDILGSLIGSIK